MDVQFAEEGPAFGVALLAAVGAGAYGSIEEACRHTIKTVSETSADAAATACYEKNFAIYQSLYPALRDSFSSLHHLES